MCKQCEANLILARKQLAYGDGTLPPQADGKGQTVLPFDGIAMMYDLPRIESRDINGMVITCLCTGCEDAFSPDELLEHSQNSDKLCVDCRGECEECGDVYGNDDDALKTAYDGDNYRHQHNEQRRCEDCCWRCADCRDYFYGDGSINASEDKICCHCAESYGTCDGCSCTIHTDDWHSIENEDGIYCNSCHDRRQDEIDAENGESDDDDADEADEVPRPRSADTLIHAYTHKPSTKFFCENAADTSWEYFGLEIETERTSRCKFSHDYAIRESGIAADGSLYVKKDGSLDDGFEIVTHPGTFKYWMAKDLNFCERLHGYGFDSFLESCGLHIHVSRSALTAAQLAKLLIFTKENVSLIRKLSRRVSDSQLDHYAPVESARTGVIIGKVNGYDTRDHPRYAAINLQNADTIEFRLFQATLVPSEIRRNIALVAALLAFIRQTSLSRLSGEDFRDFLATQGRKSVGRIMASTLIRWLDSVSPATIAA